MRLPKITPPDGALISADRTLTLLPANKAAWLTRIFNEQRTAEESPYLALCGSYERGRRQTKTGRSGLCDRSIANRLFCPELFNHERNEIHESPVQKIEPIFSCVLRISWLQKT